MYNRDWGFSMNARACATDPREGGIRADRAAGTCPLCAALSPGPSTTLGRAASGRAWPQTAAQLGSSIRQQGKHRTLWREIPVSPHLPAAAEGTGALSHGHLEPVHLVLAQPFLARKRTLTSYFLQNNKTEKQ